MKRKHKYITRNILAFVLMLSMVFGLIQCMPMVVKAATTKTVDYIDADGNLQTTEATVLTGNEAHGTWNMIPLGVEGTTTYYIAEGTLSYSAGFLLQGDVVLILGDNANLTINGQGMHVIYGKWSTDSNGGGDNLTITSQSLGSSMGKLTGTANDGINAKNITINGGDINISVTGNGCDALGAYVSNPANNAVVINGGKFTSESLIFIPIDNTCSITLGYNSGVTSIHAGEYGVYSGNVVKIDDGKRMVDADGNVYSGTLTSEQRNTMKGKTLTPADFTYATIEDIPDQTYTGNAIEPVLTVKIGEKSMTKDVDFTASYSNNADSGTATVTVTGIGNYIGTVEKTFNIVLTHNITFAAGNGATGTMDPVTVDPGAEYTLPASTFTAPDGKIFKEWSVKIGDADAVTKAAGDTITVTANTTVTAVWEDDTRIGKISSAKVHLWNDISVIMFATFTEEPTSVSMTVTMNGNETSITGSKVEDKKYSFTFAGICPELIGDDFTAVMTYVVNGENYTDTLEDYSVRKYCMKILGMSDSELQALIPETATVEETRRMAVDVLYYGAEAQNYMNHNTGNLATKDLTSAQEALASTYVTPTSNQGVVETMLSGTKDNNYYWYSAKVNLDNAATLQFYFMAPNGIEGLKVEINDTEYAIHQTSTSGKYYVEITQMSADDFRSILTARFKLNGTETGQAFSYSMNTYVRQVEDHATFGSLARRLYNYGKSAYDYAH